MKVNPKSRRQEVRRAAGGMEQSAQSAQGWSRPGQDRGEDPILQNPRSFPRRSMEIQMSTAADHAEKSQARILAEAVILQSIEDLWNPVCKRGSLVFFQGDGFILCSELAGISYVKQLVMLRMIADAGQKHH